MSWRTVIIASRCKLDLKMGSMVIRGEDTKRIFLDEIAVLVIENQRLFSKLLHDMDAALEGRDSCVVLSRQESPISFSKHVEMIVDFLHFDLNQKTLLGKVCAALESRALAKLKPEERVTIDADLCEF